MGINNDEEHNDTVICFSSQQLYDRVGGSCVTSAFEVFSEGVTESYISQNDIITSIQKTRFRCRRSPV